MPNQDRRKDLIMWMRQNKICIEDDGQPRTRMQTGLHGVTNIGDFFFDPLLSRCKSARVSSGSFSSSVLKNWTRSLSSFIDDPKKHIDLLTHFELDKSTIEVLSKITNPNSKSDFYFKEQNSNIKNVLREFIKNPNRRFNQRTHLLAYLIGNERLNIKFAFQKSFDYENIGNHRSQEHVKTGYFKFDEDIIVGYEGGFNITDNGMRHNGESANIQFSFNGTEISLKNTIRDMDHMWKFGTNDFEVRDVDEQTLSIAKEICKKWGSPDSSTVGQKRTKRTPPKPVTSNDDLIYPTKCWQHKKDATEKFVKLKNGILNMATGTGKTSTALIILSNLFQQKKVRSIVITIVGENKALLSQWDEEIKKWKNENNELYPEIANLKVIREYGDDSDFSHFINFPENKILLLSGNRRSKYKTIINSLYNDGHSEKSLIIHDEVHNFPTASMRQDCSGLGERINYRLGLSATAKREFPTDEMDEKNQFLDDEVGESIYTYELSQAIEDDVLCEFDYIKIRYELTKDEKKELQSAFGGFNIAKNKQPQDKQKMKAALIDIANIKKDAKNKIPELNSYINENNISDCLRNTLIFCNTIDYANNIAANILSKYAPRINYHTYNSSFESPILSDLLSQFKDGKKECLICCDMLTEGVDIPSLNNVILFSSERELIKTKQRIGRALRKYEDKKAIVIDFIYDPDGSDEINASDRERIEFLENLSKTKRKK